MLAPDDPLRAEPLWQARAPPSDSRRNIIRPGIERWTEARVRRLPTAGRLVRRPEFLRQVLETTTVNLASLACGEPAARVRARPLTLPLDVLRQQRRARRHARSRSGDHQLPTVDGGIYRDCLAALRRRARPMATIALPGDTHFAFVVPEPAFEDLVVLQKLRGTRRAPRQAGGEPPDGRLLQPGLLRPARARCWPTCRQRRRPRAAQRLRGDVRGAVRQAASARAPPEAPSTSSSRTGGCPTTAGGATFEAPLERFLARVHARLGEPRRLRACSSSWPSPAGVSSAAAAGRVPADDCRSANIPRERARSCSSRRTATGARQEVAGGPDRRTAMPFERFDPPGFVKDLDASASSRRGATGSSRADRRGARPGRDRRGTRQLRARGRSSSIPWRGPAGADAVEKDITWTAFPRIVKISRSATCSGGGGPTAAATPRTSTASGASPATRTTTRSSGDVHQRGPGVLAVPGRRRSGRRCSSSTGSTSTPASRARTCSAGGRLQPPQPVEQLHRRRRHAPDPAATTPSAPRSSWPPRRPWSGGVNGEPVLTAEQELIECGAYGEAERFSDPHIGARGERPGPRRRRTSRWPIRSASVSPGSRSAGWTTPDGSDPPAYWTITRGTPREGGARGLRGARRRRASSSVTSRINGRSHRVRRPDRRLHHDQAHRAGHPVRDEHDAAPRLRRPGGALPGGCPRRPYGGVGPERKAGGVPALRACLANGSGRGGLPPLSNCRIVYGARGARER